jgi:iron complex transport system substrate-binding protein
MNSREIDAEVRRRFKAGEPLYFIDVDLINSLQPELLITQAHCDVCAVTPDDVKRQGCVVADHVLALQAGTVRGIFEDISAVGRALQLEPAATDLIRGTRERIDAVHNAVRGKRRPSVVVLEWIDPMFVTGNWGPELVEAANAVPVLGEKGGYSKNISWGDLRSADPDFIVIAPCGFSLERTIRETAPLETLDGWFDLQAVKNGCVALADGNRYFNRSGTTIAETVEILSEIVHEHGRSYRDKAWQRYGEVKQTALIRQLHDEACAKGLESYADPMTGYQVLTANFLRGRGSCCGSGCRHCPYPNALC